MVLAAVEVFGTTSGHGRPEAVQQYLLGLLGRADLETRLAVLQAVEATRLRAAAPTLLAMLADDHRGLPERQGVVEGGPRHRTTPPRRPSSAALLAGSPSRPALKVEALRTLAALAPDAGPRPRPRGCSTSPTPTCFDEAVAVLGATKAGAKLVGERFLAGKLPRDLFPRVTDALQKFGADPAVAKLQRRGDEGRAARVTHDPAEVERIIRLVRIGGDAKKGKDLYLNTKMLACATCHRMEGVGGSVGPDLTRVWDTQSVEKLLESIVDPSKEIKEGYQTYRAGRRPRGRR